MQSQERTTPFVTRYGYRIRGSILVVLLLSVCAIAQDKSTYRVLEVTATQEYMEAQSLVAKLPAQLKPAGTDTQRVLVVQVQLSANTDVLLPVPTKDFALSFKQGGKDIQTPCVGISMGLSTYWGLGETEMFVQMKPPGDEKLAFLIPTDVKTVVFLHRNSDGGFSAIGAPLKVPPSK